VLSIVPKMHQRQTELIHTILVSRRDDPQFWQVRKLTVDENIGESES